MKVPLVDLKTQYQGIKGEVLSEISQVFEGMQLFLGKNVQEIESKFAAYCGTKFAVGVGSGTDALHIALRAYGVGAGDEVITVSNTFIATVEAIILAGARPVLVDIDPVTQNMDPGKVKAAITSRTKAIIPVHLFGQTVDMDPILELARTYKLKVIEDACQAHGAEYKGRRAGALGDIGCFSFYFTKNLGAYGESGVITTSDPEIANRCRMIRDHGQSSKYYHSMIGFNGRLDEIQAAVLKVKLPHLDSWINKRRSRARDLQFQAPCTDRETRGDVLGKARLLRLCHSHSGTRPSTGLPRGKGDRHRNSLSSAHPPPGGMASLRWRRIIFASHGTCGRRDTLSPHVSRVDRE